MLNKHHISKIILNVSQNVANLYQTKQPLECLVCDRCGASHLQGLPHFLLIIEAENTVFTIIPTLLIEKLA